MPSGRGEQGREGGHDTGAGRMTPHEAREHLMSGLHAVAAGEREALRDVYERSHAKLFGICLRILGDREEAEDVLQDVYVTVWNKAGSFDAERASPITWLATIARNRSIDRLRQIGPRAATVPVDEAADLADPGLDGLARLEEREDARRLRDCLGTLEARSRSAIAAAFFTGRTYQDLALEAGMPLGTMKSIVRRGLMRLRGCLEQ